MPKLHHEPKLRPKLHLNHGNYKKTAADGGASSVSEVLTSTETCVRASEHLKTTDAVEYGRIPELGTQERIPVSPGWWPPAQGQRFQSRLAGGLQHSQRKEAASLKMTPGVFSALHGLHPHIREQACTTPTKAQQTTIERQEIPRD